MKNTLDEIMLHNEKFVSERAYLPYETTKFPDKKMVVISCMDTRLVELLPKAMNFSNGDVKIIKTAGAIINHPFGSVMRSVIVALHALGAKEVFVVGHEDCGMSSFQPDLLIEKMKDSGINEDTFVILEKAGIKIKKWLRGFDKVEDSVAHSVALIKNHPLIPENLPVTGLVMDPVTGVLKIVKNGYEQ